MTDETTSPGQDLPSTPRPPRIPARDLVPTEVELAEAQAEMARCRDAASVYAQCYAVMARLGTLADDLATGHHAHATCHLRRMQAVDVAATERLAELDAARTATLSALSTAGADERGARLFGELVEDRINAAAAGERSAASQRTPVVVERCECDALVAEHRGGRWREAGACGPLAAFAPFALAGVDSVVCLGIDGAPCGHLGADHSDVDDAGGCRWCGCTRSYDHGKPSDDDPAGTIAEAVIGGACWTWRHDGAGIWARVGSAERHTSGQLRALGATARWADREASR